jgi:hypothetical protein
MFANEVYDESILLPNPFTALPGPPTATRFLLITKP